MASDENLRGSELLSHLRTSMDVTLVTLSASRVDGSHLHSAVPLTIDIWTKQEHSAGVQSALSVFRMPSAPQPQPDADQLEAAADQAITACGGDAREAVKALIVANAFLETDLEKLKAAVSTGYARGKLFEETKTLPRDRKDWYD